MSGLLWHVAVLVAAGIAAFVLLRRIPSGAPRPAVPEMDTPWPADHAFIEVRWWERRLAAARDDPERYHALVRSRLADLTAERLRLRYGAHDPARAREILGPDLHDLLTVPWRTVPTRAELARLVARIEEM
ncbi:hypothetical protein [Planobispora takensis]|uniref:Uncharacterized protein n=1 Tax=Planobispora takensis TaxID=1367882 RepID=A0A8J3T0I2_9ACTN|nr:hypothetical protein [Planobispora takensis]GII03827.1 hypothetical protein Pta02_58350 [Planobispora takensis]